MVVFISNAFSGIKFLRARALLHTSIHNNVNVASVGLHVKVKIIPRPFDSYTHYTAPIKCLSFVLRFAISKQGCDVCCWAKSSRSNGFFHLCKLHNEKHLFDLCMWMLRLSSNKVHRTATNDDGRLTERGWRVIHLANTFVVVRC